MNMSIACMGGNYKKKKIVFLMNKTADSVRIKRSCYYKYVPCPLKQKHLRNMYYTVCVHVPPDKFHGNGNNSRTVVYTHLMEPVIGSKQWRLYSTYQTKYC